MERPVLDYATIIAAAREISRVLTAGLDDPGATEIRLSRDEALLALGLVDGVVEIMTGQ